MSSRARWLLAGAGVAALLAAFPDAIFLGKRPYARDWIPYVYPDRAFLAEAWRSGDTALWNPHVFLGQPQVAIRASPLFYPPAWPFRPLGPGRATELYYALHFLLAYGGMVLLLRTLGCGPPVSALFGVTYAFSGYLLSIPDFVPWNAWVPVNLALALRAGEPGAGIRRTILLGGAIAATYLAGGMEEVYVSLLIVPFAIACRAPKRRVRRAISGLAGAGALAAGLAAVHLLPAAGFLAQSSRRVALPGFAASGWSTHPAQLLEAVFPFLFGRTLPDRDFQGEWLLGAGEVEFWNQSLYVGLLPLLLLPAAWRERRRPEVRLLLCVGLLALLAAFGRHAPLFGILRAILPFFDRFRHPAKLLLFATLAAAALGAIGAEACLRERRAGSILRGAAAFAATALLLALAPAAKERIPRPAPVLARTGAVAACLAASAWLAARRPRAGLALLAALHAADLLAANRQALPMSDPGLQDRVSLAARRIREAEAAAPSGPFRVYRSPPDARFGTFDAQAKRGFASGYERARAQDIDTLLGNVAMREGLQMVHGFSTGWDPRFERLHEVLGTRALPVLLSLLNVRYVLERASKPRPPEPPLFESAADGLRILRISDPLPRAFLVPRILRARGEDEAFARIGAPGFDPRAEAVVEDGGSGAVTLPAAPGRGTPEIASYRNGEILVRVAPGPEALLVLLDAWFPGWVAEVDGARAPILPADGAFRGVRIPAGAREIRFRYRPRSVRAGGVTSLAVLLAAALCFARRGRYTRALPPLERPA